MDRRTFVRMTAGVGLGALAGCSSGGGESNPNGETTDGGGMAETTNISMVDTSFDPVRTAVAKGATITWQNEDSYDHDVTARTITDAGTEWSFESGSIGNGETVEYTFEEAGAYEYLCTIHGVDTMCGVVLVGDPEYDATLPCEGGDDGNPGGGGVY